MSTLDCVLRRTYEDQLCSIARTLEIVGERWTLLIVREALLGRRRFEDFLENLGIARNVLTNRLTLLVDNGVFERVRYQERPARYEYRLSPKGRDLGVVVVGLMQWGDKYEAAEGPPRIARHGACGGRVVARLVCERCGRTAARNGVVLEPGPGLAHR
jgi:DNA-binding HxlR family transcriptional regulator